MDDLDVRRLIGEALDDAARCTPALHDPARVAREERGRPGLPADHRPRSPAEATTYLLCAIVERTLYPEAVTG